MFPNHSVAYVVVVDNVKYIFRCMGKIIFIILYMIMREILVVGRWTLFPLEPSSLDL